MTSFPRSWRPQPELNDFQLSLAKTSLFSRPRKPYRVHHSPLEHDMNTFWQSLHRLTQGQLFAHGYINAETATRLVNKSDATRETRDSGLRTTTCRKVVRWPRLAIPH
jgi:hypothetical protein